MHFLDLDMIMMSLTYNLTRKQASKKLDVSTRTIDRYIRRWTISYKKHANKIYLSEDEIETLKSQLFGVKQNESLSIVKNTSWEQWEVSQQNSADWLKEMVEVLQEKDKQIEAKNAMIFNMQKTITELESKLANTVALPDYNQEKEQHQIEKEKINLKNKQISQELEKEKIKNLINLAILVFFVVSIFIYAFL